jgi:hypothetical protein
MNHWTVLVKEIMIRPVLKGGVEVFISEITKSFSSEYVDS